MLRRGRQKKDKLRRVEYVFNAILVQPKASGAWQRMLGKALFVGSWIVIVLVTGYRDEIVKDADASQKADL